jgi:hypothetical protein
LDTAGRADAGGTLDRVARGETPTVASTGELRAVETYFRRLVPLAARLHRVHVALAAWAAYDAHRARPPHLRRAVPAPEVSRRALREQRALLADEIAAWQRGWLRRN